ncbi:MAG: VWA domain-containing protein [Gemmatimonadota bacterium]
MSFDNPLLLILAPVLALVVGMLAWMARGRRIARASAWSPETAALARRGGRWGPIVLALAALAAGVALAGPRGGRTEVRTQVRALNLVLAMDISRSMLAEDVQPSRLARAIRESRRLVQDLNGDRLGMIAFAGRSYILTPLTVDGGAVSLFLDGLSPDLASQGGTGLGAALAQGAQLLGDAGAADRVLVIFTDGETHDSLAETLAQARALKAQGIRLILVAEGEARPSRIPVRDSAGGFIEFQQDEAGHTIETLRRDDILQAVADGAEGALVPAGLADQAGAVRDLVAAYKRSPTTESNTADLLPLGWIPLLIAAALLLTQTLLRRTAALVGITFCVLSSRASAQRPSAGERALAAGKAKEAAAAFLRDVGRGRSDTAFYNAGTAALVAGQLTDARRDLTEAAKSLDPELRYRALYNLGVVALRGASGDSAHRPEMLDEAAARLQEALMLEPGSARAKWNLELARRHRPPPPPKNGGGGASPPPPSGGKQPQGSGGQGPSSLSQGEADQILGSVDREERNTRIKHMGQSRSTQTVVKDW